MVPNQMVTATKLPGQALKSPGRQFLQRACACGRQSGAGGECTECRNKRLGLQRQAVNDSGPATAPPIVHEVLRSPGQPLDVATRAYMEPRFGQDFSWVRVHNGEKAAASAAAVDALAYTIGQEVVFGAEQYAPGTSAGRRLIAHELTHVVQQGTDWQGGSTLRIGPPGDTFEQAAQRAANNFPAVLGNRMAAQNPPRGVIRRLGPAAAAGLAGAAALGFGLGYGAAWAYDYLTMDRERALEFARSMETISPGWLNALPDCPCEAPWSDPVNWEGDQNPSLQDAHPGATSSFRSTAVANGSSRHGQQCTYDSANRLITSGPGAGTPDFYSPARITDIPYHSVYDYKTFKELGWQTYTQYWRPNNGRGCPPNAGGSAAQ